MCILKKNKIPENPFSAKMVQLREIANQERRERIQQNRNRLERERYRQINQYIIRRREAIHQANKMRRRRLIQEKLRRKHDSESIRKIFFLAIFGNLSLFTFVFILAYLY